MVEEFVRKLPELLTFRSQAGKQGKGAKALPFIATNVFRQVFHFARQFLPFDPPSGGLKRTLPCE